MSKCSKCGWENSSKAKFCAKCGGKIIEQTTIPHTITMKCKSCGGSMTIDKNRTILHCPYCNSSELIAESDVVTVERIKQETYQKVELGRQQLERDKMQHEIAISEEHKKTEAVKKFKNSIFFKALIFFAVVSGIMGAVSFNDSKIFSGILAIIMAALFICAILVGLQVIRVKFKGTHILLAVIAFALLFPYFSLYNSEATYSESEKINWDNLTLESNLPEPPKTKGIINSDSDEELDIDIYNISKSDFVEYKNQCIDYGYTIDSENNDNSYCAYNSDGFYIDLYYFDSKKELNIELIAPETDNETTINTTVSTVPVTTLQPTTIAPTTESPTTKAPTIPETTKKPKTSEYEMAFIRIMSEYDLYYVFDTDKKEVFYFSSNDTFVDEGVYSGEFSTGVTIEWDHGEFSDKFVINGNSAIYVDPSGFEWEYKPCELELAEKRLNELQ